MLHKTISSLIIFTLFIFALWLFLPKTINSNIDNNTATILVKNGSGKGEDIYLPKQPRRVIFLNASSFDMWVQLGGADTIVGVPIFSSVDKAVYQKLSKETTILPNFSSFSTEKIMVLKPDLVIMNGNDNLRPDLKAFFSREKVPFLTLPNRSVEDTYLELELIGQLTGHPELAQQEITRLKNNLEKNTAKYKNALRKKVLMVFGTSTSFSMVTPYARQHELLKLAGGENILGKKDEFMGAKFVPLSLEYIAQADPDCILFINRGPADKMQLKLQQALAASSAWQTIRAIREGHTHVLPPELFSINPGLQTDQAVEHLSNILYPKEHP